MTEAAAIKEAAAINEERLQALLLIHRVACRALSDEERVGQRIQRGPRRDLGIVGPDGNDRGAGAGFAQGGGELLDLARAKEATAAIRAEGRKAH